MKQKLYHLFYFILPPFFLSLITRIIFTIKEKNEITHFLSFPLVFLNGLIADTRVILFFIPLVLLGFIFIRILPFAIRKTVFYIAVFINVLFWLSVALSEGMFWNEFSSRFNFIAVDYLVYTNEVIGNIKESFPVKWIALALLIATTLLFLILVKKILSFKAFEISKKNLSFALLFSLILALLNFFLPTQKSIGMGNFTEQQLSKNGLYELFSAYFHNELNWDVFYATLPKETVFQNMRESLKAEDYLLTEGTSQTLIKNPQSTSPYAFKNIIMITVESLSANFLGVFGNPNNLTPELDALAKKSLLFKNIYATGTRTVRGLEALSLSIPPTPGSSIVRRHQNKDLMSIGKLLSSSGFEAKFIYGGKALFDNMKYYFENNHYQVIDRDYFTKQEVSFETVWGVCDGDLFKKALSEADKSYQNKKPFFSMVMTTSNHRPFTYPSNLIDIPSGKSREGAVKYTDYTIGEFIKNAQSKPWFKDTLFVVVADHTSEGRGKLDIPVETYNIPLLIYSPQITPKVIETVASQIDTIPTILSLLGNSKPNMFFGRNILTTPEKEQRFFVGTYQKVGFYKNGFFVSLGPKREIQTYFYDPIKKVLGEKTHNKQIEDEAISYYQYAYSLYKNNLYK